MEIRLMVHLKEKEFNRLKHLMTDSNDDVLPKDCPEDTLGFIEIKGVNDKISIGCYKE